MDGGGRELAGVPAGGAANCEQGTGVSMGLPCCGGRCRIATCHPCQAGSTGGADGGRQDDTGLRAAELRPQDGAAVVADRGGGSGRAEGSRSVRGEQSGQAATSGGRGALPAGRSPEGLCQGQHSAKPHCQMVDPVAGRCLKKRAPPTAEASPGSTVMRGAAPPIPVGATPRLPAAAGDDQRTLRSTSELLELPTHSFQEPFGSLLLDGTLTVVVRSTRVLEPRAGQCMGVRIGTTSWALPGQLSSNEG